MPLIITANATIRTPTITAVERRSYPTPTYDETGMRETGDSFIQHQITIITSTGIHHSIYQCDESNSAEATFAESLYQLLSKMVREPRKYQNHELNIVAMYKNDIEQLPKGDDIP